MKHYLTTRDYAYSKEVYQLMLEEERSMLVTHPRPEVLGKYYEGANYISHTDGNKGLINKLYQIVRRYSISRKLHLLHSYLPVGASILDVGAGTGAFVLAAKKMGWDAKGVEPNRRAREQGLKKGAELKESLDDLDRKHYSLITLWHVLEHLPDLEVQIRHILLYLETGGTLVLALPNFKSWDARHYKEYWAAYDVPRHLWHFSRESITNIFADFDFEIIACKPMIFDSFYISLLSEKYKNGWSNPIMAFLVGLYSNISAWRSKEYSSMIYILQHTKN